MVKQERFKKVIEWKERHISNNFFASYYAFGFLIYVLAINMLNINISAWWFWSGYIFIVLPLLFSKKRKVYYVKIKEVER